MHMHRALFVVLLIVQVGSTIGTIGKLHDWLCRRHPHFHLCDSSRTRSPPNYDLARSLAPSSTLFLLLEAPPGGINAPDFNPTTHDLPPKLYKYFNNVAIMCPNHILPGEKQPSVELACWTEVESKVKSVCPSCTTERWLNLYFRSDGICELAKCFCKDAQVCPPPQNPTPPTCTATNDPNNEKECESNLSDYVQLYNSVGLTGISFDQEPASAFKIVPAMESVATKHSPPLKLAWTLGLADMKWAGPYWCGPTCPPGSAPSALGSKLWEFSLGQAYTDQTQYLYELTEDDVSSALGCTTSPSFWGLVAKKHPLPTALPPGTNTAGQPAGQGFWAQHMVPMVCGAGNCQEPAVCKKSPCPSECKSGNLGVCIDERLSSTQLDVVMSKLALSPYRNMAVWLGTVKKTNEFCNLASSAGNWSTGCMTCANHGPSGRSPTCIDRLAC